MFYYSSFTILLCPPPCGLYITDDFLLHTTIPSVSSMSRSLVSCLYYRLSVILFYGNLLLFYCDGTRLGRHEADSCVLGHCFYAKSVSPLISFTDRKLVRLLRMLIRSNKASVLQRLYNHETTSCLFVFFFSFFFFFIFLQKPRVTNPLT